MALSLSLSLFFFLMAAHEECGNSWANGAIGATAAGLDHIHSTTGSEPHL